MFDDWVLYSFQHIKEIKKNKKVLSGCIYFSVLYFYKQINTCFEERPYLNISYRMGSHSFHFSNSFLVNALVTDKSHIYLRIGVIAIIYIDNLLHIWCISFMLDVSLYTKVILVSKWALIFIDYVILSINWTQTKFDCWGDSIFIIVVEFYYSKYVRCYL